MTNNEIYKAALHILAETSESADTSDYAERFPYILALFCGEAEDLDSKYRKAHGLPVRYGSMSIAAEPDEDFPLSDPFAHAALYYLSSMLVVDENPELSDKLFERYSARMADIYSSLPSELEKIKNVYN
ncbi:MAG: hypothetical protein E7671_03395 [Ruminococcaceae bacterium]|nr:hypothetical protein [Oscillospiraceae bacterium]